MRPKRSSVTHVDENRKTSHDASFLSRTRPGDVRDTVSVELDAAAARADAKATARDSAADVRDDAEIAREIAGGGVTPAASHARYWALRDRLDAAGDRIQSANQRVHSRVDRMESAEDRLTLSLDELTGAYRRDSGLIELTRDLILSRRTGQSMVLGFLDVDGLKRVNDAHGHTAGDAVLQAVSRILRSKLRQYDLVVRYGGDEFLFAITGVPEADVDRRVEVVNAVLRDDGYNTVTYGLVTIAPDERLPDAIDRADRLLYERRRRLGQH